MCSSGIGAALPQRSAFCCLLPAACSLLLGCRRQGRRDVPAASDAAVALELLCLGQSRLSHAVLAFALEALVLVLDPVLRLLAGGDVEL